MNTEQYNEHPLHITSNRIIDQLSHLVPQVHLTLISILQSIALAVLLTNLHAPHDFTVSSIIHAALVNAFYFPQIASLLFIVAVWNQETFATIILHWPISTMSTLLQSLLCIGEIAAFSSINSVGGWLFWMGLTFLIGFSIRRRNRVITVRRIMLQNTPYQQRVYHPLRAVPAGLLGFLSLVLGWLRSVGFSDLGHSITVTTIPVVPFDIVASIIFIVFCLATLYNDDITFSRILSEVLKGTPYKVNRGFVIDEQHAQP